MNKKIFSFKVAVQWLAVLLFNAENISNLIRFYLRLYQRLCLHISFRRYHFIHSFVFFYFILFYFILFSKKCSTEIGEVTNIKVFKKKMKEKRKYNTNINKSLPHSYSYTNTKITYHFPLHLQKQTELLAFKQTTWYFTSEYCMN